MHGVPLDDMAAFINERGLDRPFIISAADSEQAGISMPQLLNTKAALKHAVESGMIGEAGGGCSIAVVTDCATEAAKQVCAGEEMFSFVLKSMNNYCRSKYLLCRATGRSEAAKLRW